MSVSTPSSALRVGQSATLTASAATGGSGVSVQYQWSSSAPAIASVSTNGAVSTVVTAVAPGTAVITVSATGSGSGFTSNTLSATAVVTVTAVPDANFSLVVTPSSGTITVGQTLQLTAASQGVPSGASVSCCSYTPDDPTIATVSAAGLVTAVRVGSTAVTVSATASGAGFTPVTRSARVTINTTAPQEAITGVSITPSFGTLWVGETLALDVAVAKASDAVQATTTFGSSNTTVATVSAQGEVTAIAPGVTSIEITVSGSGTGFVTSTRRSSVAITVSRFTSITAGALHTCGIAQDSTAYCWGDGSTGALGHNGGGSGTMQPVAGNYKFTALSAGWLHTCGVTTARTIVCWGDNTDSQLGDGSGNSGSAPRQVASALAFAVVSSGKYHSCALTTTGQAYCWGARFANNFGQLGYGLDSLRQVPIAVAGGLQFTSISAGHQHTCATSSDGGLYCWGFGVDAGAQYRLVPTRISTAVSFRAVSAGQSYTCGLSNAGQAYCWGILNRFGQLGNGSFSGTATAATLPPAPVNGLSTVTLAALHASNLHTCAVSSTTTYCWGANADGQIGDNTTGDRASPVGWVLTGRPLTAIATGGTHSCGLTAQGAVFCWGSNVSGQIGDGTFTSRLQATRVRPPR